MWHLFINGSMYDFIGSVYFLRENALPIFNIFLYKLLSLNLNRKLYVKKITKFAFVKCVIVIYEKDFFFFICPEKLFLLFIKPHFV